MSNAAALAAILKKVGDAMYTAADDLNALAADVAVTQPAAGAVPSAPAPVDDLPPMEPAYDEFPPGHPVQGEGSLAQCPKHRRPYKEGKFGPFCTSTSDDPAWSNAKGYCTINPKNVDVWLRAQAA